MKVRRKSGFGVAGSLVVFLSVALVIGTGCVSTAKFNQVRDQLNACEGRDDDLERQIADARASYNALKTSLDVEIAADEVTIQQMQFGVTVILPEELLFSSGSAEVHEKGKKVLGKIAPHLAEVKQQIVVVGFTDDVPIGKELSAKYPSNWSLGAARAVSVVHSLELAKVPGKSLMVVSMGENNPVASNDTAQGRAKNRRIEIRVRPVNVSK